MARPTGATGKWLMGTALASILMAALSGCGASPGSSRTTLILYNGQHPQTTDSLVTAFEHQTGIQVEVRSNDEDVLADQIKEEGTASPADLIYTENSPALEYLQSTKLLARVPQSTLSRVPAKYNSPASDWVGVSARVSVLVYNTTLLKPSQLPTSVLALADPKWRGLLAIAPGETDFQPIITSIARTYGKTTALKWLEGVGANAQQNRYPDNETITARVNSGQAAIGIINQYYWYRLRAEIGSSQMRSAISYLAPRNPGYVVDVSGAAVLKSSRHQAAADRFLAFLVSRQGQEILAHSDSFEYPLGSGVVTARALRPFASLQPAPLTIADLGDGAEAVALLHQSQLL
ncbi:MAG TPA: extracellular solute-binding protein [Candidatus Dormibacteraeota bacterium]|nr:extracellular solute-binding protein [Candidatus Dormibacteraeota bacterium]